MQHQRKLVTRSFNLSLEIGVIQARDAFEAGTIKEVLISHSRSGSFKLRAVRGEVEQANVLISHSRSGSFKLELGYTEEVIG